jgi:hypothetical protein
MKSKYQTNFMGAVPCGGSSMPLRDAPIARDGTAPRRVRWMAAAPCRSESPCHCPSTKDPEMTTPDRRLQIDLARAVRSAGFHGCSATTRIACHPTESRTAPGVVERGHVARPTPDLRWRQAGLLEMERGNEGLARAYLTRAAHYADKPAQAMLAELLWKRARARSGPKPMPGWIWRPSADTWCSWRTAKNTGRRWIGMNARPALALGQGLYAGFGDARGAAAPGKGARSCQPTAHRQSYWWFHLGAGLRRAGLRRLGHGH